MIPAKLLYPILEPELDFKFNKGFYARVNLEKSIMYGRVFRLFLFPLLNTSSDYTPIAAMSNPNLPQITDLGGGYTLSGDRSSGVAPALPVTLSGQVSNVGQGSLSFDSSSSGVTSVTLTDGWTGTDLQAQIDSLTWTAEDVLQNGDLNDYHNELFVVTPVTTDNDDIVQVPDGWTIVRASGTEPILRIFSEAETEIRAKELLELFRIA